MKKILVKAVSAFLAVLMMVLSPIQTFAAADVKYISEIRIGYGDSGKKQLEDDGYIVWENLNANDGGTGSAVYLGYKTTDKKEDAVTDLAVMPMSYADGAAYSFDAYKAEMENLSKQIDQMLENFDAAISEYRTNLAKPSPENDYALRAYKMLNMYIEDDTNLPLGKLFANGEIDDNGNFVAYETEPNTTAYHNVLMMGNSTAVYAVQIALAVACTETGGETFLDRLEKTTSPDEVPASMNGSITTLASCLSDFQDNLSIAQAVYNNAEAYEGGREAYLEAAKKENTDEFNSAVAQINLIEIMDSITYGNLTWEDNTPCTFLDIMTLPTDTTSGSTMYLDTTMLSMLASAMTPGQIAISGYVGLSLLINNASSTKLEKEDGHYALGMTDACLEQLDQIEAVSVYLGVDRSVFADGDYGTVAITDAAIRDGIQSDKFGVTAEYDSYLSNAEKIALGVSAGVCATAAVGCITYAVKMWGKTAIEVPATAYIPASKTIFYTKTVGSQSWTETVHWSKIEQEMLEFDPQVRIDRIQTDIPEKTIETTRTKYVTSTGTKVTAVVGAVFAAAAIALSIYTFVQSIREPEREKVDYTAIPRAIIDVKTESDGESNYFVYYAARLAGASDDYKNEKDTTKLYGDLNGLNGYEKWLCLYYAKDLRIGSPITTTILVKSAADLTSLQTKSGYVPIHDFFNNTLVANNTGYTAFNLNSLSTSANASNIYVYFKRNLNEPALTSSIVDEESSFNWISIVTFFIGAGLASGAAVLIGNKKKIKEEA